MSILQSRTPSPNELLKKLHRNNLPKDQNPVGGVVNVSPKMRSKMNRTGVKKTKPDYRTPQRDLLKKRSKGDVDNTTYQNHRGWGLAEPSVGNYYASGGYVNDIPQGRYNQSSQMMAPANMTSYDDNELNGEQIYNQSFAPQMYAFGGTVGGLGQQWGGNSWNNGNGGMRPLDGPGSRMEEARKNPYTPQPMPQPGAGWQINPNRNNGGTYAATTNPYANGTYIRTPTTPGSTQSSPGGVNGNEFEDLNRRGGFAHGGMIGSHYPHHYASGGAASTSGGWGDMLGNFASKAIDYGTKIASNPYVQKAGKTALQHGTPLAMGALQGGLQNWQQGGSFREGARQGTIGAMQQSDNPYMRMGGMYAERPASGREMANNFGQRAIMDSGFGDTQMGRGARHALDAWSQGSGVGQVAQAGLRGSGNMYGGMAADYMANPGNRRAYNAQIGQQAINSMGYGNTAMGRGANAALGAYGRGDSMRDIGMYGAMGALPQNQRGDNMRQAGRAAMDAYDRGGDWRRAGAHGLGSYLSNMQNPNARQVGRAMQSPQMRPQWHNMPEDDYGQQDDYGYGEPQAQPMFGQYQQQQDDFDDSWNY